MFVPVSRAPLISFPTLLKYPLGEAKQTLDRLIKRMNGFTPLGGTPNFRAMNVGVLAPPVSWWQSGGATGVIGAYRARGATSYAASKVNLANPGVFDLTDPSTPEWNTTDGWVKTDTGYFTTGIVPLGTYTALCQYSDATNSVGYLFGSYNGTTFSRFGVLPNFIAVGHIIYLTGGGATGTGDNLASGNVCVAGTKGYRDGVLDATGLPADFSDPLDIYLFGTNTDGSYSNPIYLKIQAFVVYDNQLSDARVGAVAAAMAAL